jgi:histidinol-phosphate phosphatase family protein
MQQPAVFLDKDGTLLADVPYNVDPSMMRFAPGARDALALLASQPLRLFVISNQKGVALGKFDFAGIAPMEAHLKRMFASCGATLSGAYWCPHHPDGDVLPYAVHCTCRKPQPGMLSRAAREHSIDLPSSWFVGDILDDTEAGCRAGCRTILIDNGNESEWRYGPQRIPDFHVSDLYRAAQTIVRHREIDRAGLGVAHESTRGQR